ncbi:MAG: GHKL domain-containing protein [Clostridiales bacterium]|nr:GHKL domain-containing protein [Clostridiales bacterium]
MTELTRALIRYVPNVVGQNLLLLFFVDGVLKYRFKSRKVMCIIVVVLGLIVGLCSAYSVTHPLPKKIQADLGIEFLYEGDNVEDNTDDITELISYEFTLVMIVIIAVGIRDKISRKIAVAICSVSLHMEFNTLFSLLHSTVMDFFKGSEMNVFLFFGSMYLFMLLEFLLFAYIAKLRTKYDNTPMPVRIIFLAFIFFGLFVSVFTGLLLEQSNNNFRRVVTIISLLMVLAGTLIFFYIRAARKERARLLDVNDANEQLITAQTEYFEASARADKEIRAMRHDMKNNIQVLSLLLENKEYDKMHDYLDELGEGLQNTDISAHTGNTIADAIIADKTIKATELGLNLRSSGQIKGVDISSVDMCKILANILDNAIEAASVPDLAELSSEIKTITLDFRSTGNFFMISCTNPCSSCPIIKDGQIETSKKDRSNHGFGLKNISTAAGEYGGEVSFNCDKTAYGGMFTVEVMIPFDNH